MGNRVSLEENLINLRMTSKQMSRESVKCQAKQKEQEAKIKKAIQQGNHDGARIYAQNAIREKNQSLNYLRLGSRLDGVASRLDTAIRMNNVSQTMGSIVKGMDSALKSMNVEKITKIMDEFEAKFETMDVQSGVMENAMESTMATSTPADEVDNLVKQVAVEHNLELGEQFGEVGSTLPTNNVQNKDTNMQDLEARLAGLR